MPKVWWDPETLEKAQRLLERKEAANDTTPLVRWVQGQARYSFRSRSPVEVIELMQAAVAAATHEKQAASAPEAIKREDPVPEKEVEETAVPTTTTSSRKTNLPGDRKSWEGAESKKFDDLAAKFPSTGLSQGQWALKIARPAFPDRTVKALHERLRKAMKARVDAIAAAHMDEDPIEEPPAPTPAPAPAPAPTPAPAPAPELYVAPPAPPTRPVPTAPAAMTPTQQMTLPTPGAARYLPSNLNPRNARSTLLEPGVAYDAVIVKIMDFGVIVEVLIGDAQTGRIYTGLCHINEIWAHGYGSAQGLLLDEWFDEGEVVQVHYSHRSAKGFMFSMRRAGYVPQAKRGRWQDGAPGKQEPMEPQGGAMDPQGGAMEAAFERAMIASENSGANTYAPTRLPYQPPAANLPLPKPVNGTPTPAGNGHVERMDNFISGMALLWNEVRGKLGEDNKAEIAALKTAIIEAHTALTRDFDSRKAIMILGSVVSGGTHG